MSIGLSKINLIKDAIAGMQTDLMMKSAKAEREVERGSTLNMVRYIAEILKRKLHLEGCGSICPYVMKELNYTENEALPRIRVAELVNEIPDVDQMMAANQICFSVVVRAQNYFRKERKEKRPVAKKEKLRIIESLCGVSMRKADKMLATLFPESNMAPDKYRATSENTYRYEHNADNALHAKIERLKDVLAHLVYDGEMNKLLHIMADAALEKYDPLVKAEKAAAREKWKASSRPYKNDDSDKVNSTEPSQNSVAATKERNDAAEAFSKMPRSRHVPAQEARKIEHLRTKGCAHVDPRTGEKCGSHHGLQKDHCHEFFLGGNHKAENLQWLCGPHNRWKHAKISAEMRRAGFGIL